jgi:hypothetical protein
VCIRTYISEKAKAANPLPAMHHAGDRPSPLINTFCEQQTVKSNTIGSEIHINQISYKSLKYFENHEDRFSRGSSSHNM